MLWAGRGGAVEGTVELLGEAVHMPAATATEATAAALTVCCMHVVADSA